MEIIIEGYRVADVSGIATFGTKGFAKRTVMLVKDPVANHPDKVEVELPRREKHDYTKDITETDRGRTVSMRAYLNTRRWSKNGKSGTITSVQAAFIVWGARFNDGRGEPETAPAPAAEAVAENATTTTVAEPSADDMSDIPF